MEVEGKSRNKLGAGRLFEGEKEGMPDEVLNPKKKVWEKLSEELKVSSEGLAQWQGNDLVTPKGKITCCAVKSAPIR